MVAGVSAFYGSNRLGTVSVPAVAGAMPEPGTWAPMLLGYGGVGFAMHRRKSKIAYNAALA